MIDSVERGLNRGFESSSFTRKGRRWYHDAVDAVSVVDRQKSQFGPMSYLNVGIWPTLLGGPARPTAEECPIYARAGRLAPYVASEISGLLNYDLELDDEDRESKIAELVVSSIAPTVVLFSGLAFLRSKEAHDVLRFVRVSSVASALIEMPES